MILSWKSCERPVGHEGWDLSTIERMPTKKLATGVVADNVTAKTFYPISHKVGSIACQRGGLANPTCIGQGWQEGEQFPGRSEYFRGFFLSYMEKKQVQVCIRTATAIA